MMLCCCCHFSLSNASDGLTPVPTAPGPLRYISLQPSPAPRASGRSTMSVALCLQPSPELAGHGGGRRGWPPCSDKQQALCSPSGVGTQGDWSACLGLEGSWKARGWGDLERAGKARGSPPGTASLPTEWAGPMGGAKEAQAGRWVLTPQSGCKGASQSPRVPLHCLSYSLLSQPVGADGQGL